MMRYIVRRFATMAVTLAFISALVFVVIKLPPGDFLSNQLAELRSENDPAASARADELRLQYGLDRPAWEQYLVWVGAAPGPNGFYGLLQGNLGWSFEYRLPVSQVIGKAIVLTILVNIGSLIFVHVVAIPLALYSATHRKSKAARGITTLSYLGFAMPSFLLALVLLFYLNRWFGISIGGLMDPAYADGPLSMAKMGSVASHLIVPIAVIGLSGASAMIRRMRANLLDELQKQYTVTAKAKGLPPTRALIKYPFRMALNPFVADIGNMLPHLVSGSVLVSLVLSLPTVGPILVRALKVQDQYLAGSILMFVAALTVVGMLIADLMLAVIDPRIRLGEAR